jgi:hypothetical protein
MIGQLRRRPLFALAALAGFFFTATTEASGVEPCPYHDGIPVAAVETSPQTGPASQDDDSHVHGAAASLDDASNGGHDAHQGGCSCLGECGTSNAPPLPRTAELGVKVVVAVSVTPRAASDSSVSHRTGGLFLRHLPTAPPVTV